MPEGPEIRRAADKVADAIANRTTTEVFFGLSKLKRFEKLLSGQKVRKVESRGKAMLIRFANGLNIYSHNQLYGRWHTVPAHEFPDTNRQLRLAIHNRKQSALLYSASDIAVLKDEALDSHPFLRKLGPDPLSKRLNGDAIVKRLLLPECHRRQLGTLLTDQSFLAGIGNYLRCEALFLAGLHQRMTAQTVDPGKLQRLADSIPMLMHQSYETGGITNDRNRAERLMADGASFEEARFWVFRRAGLPCYQCGTLIEKDTRKGQPWYYCPKCQALNA